MWPILIVSRDRNRCAELVEALSALDRRVRIHCAAGAAEALTLASTVAPMLAVISDTHSADRTLRVVAALRRAHAGLPLLVEVPAEHPMVDLQAVAAGATDCLREPVAPWEWRRRAASLIDAQRQRQAIGRMLRHRARCLQRAEEGIAPADLVSILARADTFHDAVTGDHERRTGQLARLIAEGLGLPSRQCRLIQAGAGLHDLGKIGIPDEVLHKPGRYGPEEYGVMRAHPQIGHDILRNGASPVLRLSAQIALSHHERYDGSGYPHGLAGEAIPLPARIVAVADVFDALTARRHYRQPLPVKDGIAYLRRLRARHFDPDCVEALRAQGASAAQIVGETPPPT